jgi:MFS family permease
MYGDIADARGFGGAAAATTFSAIAVGSLLAAPLAGRWADRNNPVRVAAGARVALALAVLALGFANSVATVWLAAAAVGAAVAVSQPAVQVILLAWTDERRSRDVFAWQFIGMNLALAVGGLIGGFVVNLDSPTGTRPIYLIAAVGAALSAVAVGAVGRGAHCTSVDVDADADEVGVRQLLRRPAIRWLLIVTIAITLACYAQYESGLPAYALGSLHISPKVLGTAVALNAIAVAVLTKPIVSATRRHSPTTLLAVCATVWIGCWLLLGLPLLGLAGGGFGTIAVLGGYTSFSIGETMLAPVLSPLAAELSPDGATGRTLAAVTGATTLATAVGPAISGVLLALHLPTGFIVLQLGCCLATIAAARRLATVRRATTLAHPPVVQLSAP